jgi:hypothetical protein
MSFQQLEMETAVALMGVLSTSKDEEFKEKLAAACKTMAEHKKGLFAMASVWHGTPVPLDVLDQVHDMFGTEFLYQRNVVSCDGTSVELNVLTAAMPDEFLENFFHFDMKERAEKEGLTVAQVEEFIKDTYRGLSEEGDYLFEFEKVEDRFKYFMVLGIGGFGRSSCGKYHRIYTEMSTFGVKNIRNILFRNLQGENNGDRT